MRHPRLLSTLAATLLLTAATRAADAQSSAPQAPATPRTQAAPTAPAPTPGTTTRTSTAPATPASPGQMGAPAIANSGTTSYAATRMGEIDPPTVARDTTRDLRRGLAQYPPSVVEVLALDPTLLSNAPFLESYPWLRAFLDQHPEVRRNPEFFFPRQTPRPRSGAADLADAIWVVVPVGAMTLTFLLALGVLRHRRWRQAFLTQKDAQTKLLDRLLAREDIVAYLDTPAGRRLFEAAPVLADPQPGSTPMSRIISSAQAGILLLTLGSGFGLIRAFAATEDGRFGFLVITVVLLTVGLGSLLSSGASYLLSRRFGLLDTTRTRD